MIRILIYLAIAAALVGGTWAFLEKRCNTACRDARAELAAARAEIAAANKEAERVRAARAQESVKAAFEAAARERERNERFAPVVAEARNLPASVGGVRFPDAAARVLNDAVDAANARIAEPAARPAEEARPAPASANVGDVVTWGVTCSRMYSELVDQVLGWQAFYAGLQRAELAEQLH